MQYLVMRKVLITGGAGFIGSSLASALLLSEKNYHVTVLDNLSRGRLENISQWLELPNFEFVNVDLLDYSNSDGQKASTLQKIVNRSDIIFHLAANPDVAIGTENTQIDFQQNVQATYNLLESVRKSQQAVDTKNTKRYEAQNKKKLIFTSSSTVYGRAKKRPTPENYSPLCPISLYGSTKLAGESIISGYCHMFGIYCIVARLANIIGPANTHGVIHDFIKKLTDHPDLLDILGNGQQDKSYLYIDDCVNALILLSDWMQIESCSAGGASETNKNIDKQKGRVALENSASENVPLYGKEGYDSQFQVFNIGSDDTITVLQIAQIVIEQLSLGSQKVKTVFRNNFEDGRGWKGDVPDFWLDCSRLKGIGWAPKYSRSKDAVMRACEEYVKRGVGGEASVSQI
jgi:UDP-glucose 4-epimerase